MLMQYTDEFPLLLRLVVFTLLIPADTSECERVFSLMNDIKTAERNSLGQKQLRNLMLWHNLATKEVPVKDATGKEIDGKTKHISLLCKEVPVMAILAEFRGMASEIGRKTHRGVPIPMYEYEKHRQN